MRQKIITALSLVILFSVVFGAQLATTASAETKNGNPLSAPLTFFRMTGSITYKSLTFFRHGAQRLAPATDVTVTAENIFTHDIYTTTTDSDGHYTLDVEEKGLFLVRPSSDTTSAWVPPLQTVRALHSQTKHGIDFQGLTVK